MKGLCFRLGDRYFFRKMTYFDDYFENISKVILEKGVFEYTTVMPINKEIIKGVDSILFLNIPYDMGSVCSCYLCTDFSYTFEKDKGVSTFYLKNLKKIDSSALSSFYLLKQDCSENVSISEIVPSMKRINRFYWYSE